MFRFVNKKLTVSPTDFHETTQHIALCISQARARFDWALAEYQLTMPNIQGFEEQIRERAAEPYAARAEFSDAQNWELGMFLALQHHTISMTA
ncbi:MAG: hypothetical protein A3C85_02040 [Candidatus Doudnabacteria bacterium RIFCSPHIGHO2_02_FULL_48_21]|uniref:Uncharacterized protein n=1 Tax=Candidatus Doudnabacteria bacterium RIFCSPLOWO2_02_FULL_48_13 TaxID=1817845 RepID=A0A1F5Q8T7_9BACT|nr:MAG: hypothetical protein A3K05_02245 [Candidatus Doudnabacteria bacterium RIFCSPHIGHO2_01_48_18]OGE91394.1 MAG: hypothetical protein A3F44_03795 [Candidatus Doudnabacteria bacterium RIFCSPHIGHO2_12_FULL_47_25]OGE93206.1 MAG: hypothetical protein A3C85_02040 [Candidatus Doudnabacteria bacterium RIFCSPHIGHO2_02_FULL_48_21]OGE98536.1 MAG: hypothetical protein A3J05_04140 [Candidatus Doudnabacteria bacterium RIFCSPLOWO2_02_FULL_48_13]OGF01850.1 MAG: hypothetical protein A3G07_03865 [Candidatus 